MKEKILALVLSFALVLGVVGIIEPAVANAEEMTLVTEGYYDTNIIPDKYNTGCDESVGLTVVDSLTTIDGIKYKLANENTTVFLDFQYGNPSLVGQELTIENMDFSQLDSFSVGGAGETGVTIHFVNCKFKLMTNYEADSASTYTFDHCTFTKAMTVNSTFNWCSFGGTLDDGMQPFYNVTVNNCFFYNFPPSNSEGKHTDGVQTFGKEGVDVKNINFNNVRFEMPTVANGSEGQINAPIAASPKFSNADGIHFSNCIVNGGGYSIYACDYEGTTTLENVTFDNISVGAAKLYGTFYPGNADEVVFTSVYDIEKLYVASVWEDDDGNAHLSVTNDTAEDKTLVVVTEDGTETFDVICTATAKTNGATDYDDYPYDIDIVLANEDADYVICYDSSVSAENQIRFVNWTDEPVYGVGAPAQTPEEGKELVTETYRDTLVIPDKHNTGCSGELVPATEYFGASYPEEGALYITTSIQNTFGTVYENIHFDRTVSLNKQGLQSMVFRNCKFSTNGAYAINTGNNFDSENVTVTFENCEFMNQSSACVQPTENFKFVNCKIHDMGSDGGKGFDNGGYENCYFYNIGSTDGAHADGMQVTSSATGNENFYITNCRFDAPSYNEYITNAAIFFVLEGDCYNSVVRDCMLYGGNYSLYYGRKTPEDNVVIENNVVENIIIGAGYQFGKFTDNSGTVDVSEIKDADKLFVSSVVKEDDTIRLLVSNYTNEEKTLKVVTNTGTKSVTIPAAPTHAEGKTYTTFSQFPFDVEVETTGDYVVCYDTAETAENQIRFVNYGDAPVYRSVAPSTEPGESIYSQPGTGSAVVELTVTSVYSVRIPKKITLDGNTKEGSYTVSVCGDIPAGDSVSVIPTSTFEMEQVGKDNVTATVTQNKTVWSANEVTADEYATTTGTISAEDLTAGEWSGVLVFNISLSSE